MNVPFFGTNAPKFKIPSQPELEQALNLLATSIDSVSNKIPRIQSGDDISVTSAGQDVFISSLVQSKNSVKPFRITIGTDGNEDMAISIATGMVGVIVNGVITPIAPKIKGVYNYSGDSIHRDRSVSFTGPYFKATEAFPKTGVFVKITKDSADIILHNLDSSDYPTFEPETLFFKIGEIRFLEEAYLVDQTWESDIFLSADIKQCPFMLYDATDYHAQDRKLSLGVKSTVVYQGVGKGDARYPSGMGETWSYEQDLPDDSNWKAVYVVMEFDRATKKLQTYEGAVYVSLENGYRENTETLQYELIGEVTRGYGEDGKKAITYISSVCQEVIPDWNKLKAYCSFFTKDVSKRDAEGNVTLSLLSIKPEYVEGRLPSGMVDGEDLVIGVPDSALGRGRFNVYLKMMLDETGTIADYPDALSIEITKYERSSGSSIKWYQIAQVVTISTGQNDVIDYVVNQCPSAYSDLPNDCAFEIEDATDEEGVKTQIRIGKVNGDVYPEGMIEGKVFQMAVPDTSVNWYAVYIQVLLNGDGSIKKETGAVTLSFEEEYKQSNALMEWVLLGEVTISSREGTEKDENGSGGRYISYIQNYCNKAETPKRNWCYFEVLDASPAPDHIQVLIKNDTVNWSDRYPDNMSADTTYVMTLDENEPWHVIYVVMDVDPETQEIKGGGDSEGFAKGYCYIESSSVYKPFQDGEKFYFQIAEVNIGKDADDNAVIDYISSTCQVPSYPIKKEYCPFFVSDRSTYNDKGQSTNCVVKIQNDTVEGYKYPSGMDADSEYNLTIKNDDVDAAGIAYIYLRLEFDANGKLETYPDAVTFQVSNRYLSSGVRTNFILVASVETERNGCIVPNKIANRCPNTPTTTMESCPFQIEDVSSSVSELVVLVSNGTINDVYPEDMTETGRFELPISSNSTWYAIYAKIKLDNNGALSSEANAIKIGTYEEYMKSNAYFQYALLGEVSVSNDSAGGKYISNIQNYCYSPKVEPSNNCPFECVDATLNNSAGVVIRSGMIEGVWPKDMSKDEFFYLPVSKPWKAIYAVLKVSDGALIKGEDAVTIVAKDDYTDSTETEEYQLLAEVNVEDKEGGGTEVTFIKNYCYVPKLVTAAGSNRYCPFKLSDGSDYNDQGEPTNCKVLVQNDQVDGRWPEGMDGIDDYILTINESDVDSDTGITYIYLRLEVTKNGVLEDYNTAITIQPSSTPISSGARTQFILIGTAKSTQGKIVPNSILSVCPVPTVEVTSTCPFEVEDASYEGNVIILVNNGKVDGAYPKNMEEGNRFTLTLPDSAGWSAIYFVTKLNYYGAPDYQSTDYMQIEVLDDYRINTAYYQYDLLAEVTVSDDGGGGLYISNIMNYCNQPKIVYSMGCPFECVDATNQDIGITGIVIRNGEIEGDYPTGMTATGMTYLETPDPWNAVYAVIAVDSDGKYNGSSWFEVRDSYAETEEFKSYQLIAEVNVGAKDGGGSEITFIKNYCYVPNLGAIAVPAPVDCPFEVTKASVGSSLRVKVKQGLIAGRWPDGMGLGYPDYILEISESCYIYCKMVFVQNDVVLRSEQSAISFLQSSNIQESTIDDLYVLVAVVLVVSGYIKTIQNTCRVITPSACDLKWS